MPRSPAAPQPTGAARDNAPETGDNPDQATPPPSADGDHLPVIEPSDVRVTVDATTDDTEPVPDGSASAIGGRDTITAGSAMPDGAVDATTADATTPAGEVNALTNNITAGTAMPVGAVSAVTGITPDTPGDDTSEESDDIPSEDSGQFRAALDAAALRNDPDDLSRAEDELGHLHWVALDTVRGLDMPFITEVVLAELAAHLDGRAAQGVPFFDNRHEVSRFWRL